MQKTGKKNFRGSQEHFLHKSAIWDRTPPTYTSKCSLHVCRRVQGSQIFKQNSIILIRSKVIAFLVILLSPWSPHGPCHPHIIAIAPRRFPIWSPWLWSPWSPPHVVPLVPVVPTSSLWSPCHPRCPHIIPTLSRRCPHHSQPPATHSTHPSPPWGGGGPKISKNAIRFELIEIF